MTTLREAAQQALEYMKSVGQMDMYPEEWAIVERLDAALAEPEQRPISDVTEAVTKTVIEVEKLLCGKLGRQWQPSGMSIQTLVDELAALVAAAEREACAKVCEEVGNRDADTHAWDAADAIRARGEFGKQLGVWNNGH
jgi:hypothetical protein